MILYVHFGNKSWWLCNYQRLLAVRKPAQHTRVISTGFTTSADSNPPRIDPSVCLVKADPAEGFATNAVAMGTVRAAAESTIASPGGAMIVRVRRTALDAGSRLPISVKVQAFESRFHLHCARVVCCFLFSASAGGERHHLSVGAVGERASREERRQIGSPVLIGYRG